MDQLPEQLAWISRWSKLHGSIAGTILMDELLEQRAWINHWSSLHGSILDLNGATVPRIEIGFPPPPPVVEGRRG